MQQTNKTLLILGAGGHGKSVAEAALLSGQWHQVIFADDRWPHLKDCLGFPVVANLADIGSLVDKVDGAIAAVGNNKVRAEWTAQIIESKLPLATVIHPSAFVSQYAEIGLGTAIMAHVVVGAETKVGQGAILNANATLDHDASMGDYAHLGVGVQIAGGVQIGNYAWLQAGVSAGYHVIVNDFENIAPGTTLAPKS